MAFRAAVTKQWRSMLINSAGQSRAFSLSGPATATSRKYVTTAAAPIHEELNLRTAKAKAAATGDWAPVMIMGGFMVVVLTIASHSAWQQLAYAPSVHIRKKKRETLPEVYAPNAVVGSADKFINKSFFRKVGHIQDNNVILEDSSRPDPFTRSREIHSLKSVGVGK
ncbi:OLC1v1025892C1 [Oldenlandia corymbosa var. corymbosa]|uniref:OLC1v1025892C1 n=1 Tax=Oldenlandia corymbosa var. corymbosa TaxID=529605 RepID=A0AAV1C8M1_OLDCO|nr:OLC1v1025892C1 [Oldenlandia corymbosa var. corymbosa]